MDESPDAIASADAATSLDAHGYLVISVPELLAEPVRWSEIESFFAAAAASPSVADAATSDWSPAMRGYSRENTENFASLIGAAGKANDHVAKFRVGADAKTTPTPFPEVQTRFPPLEKICGWKVCSPSHTTS